MPNPSYYEHSCGFYHAVGHKGGCGDDATRFIIEELDERHGDGAWDEIDSPEEVISVTSEVKRKNYDRLRALTADKDIDGNSIEIGCKVRSFDCVYYDPGNDWLIGLDTTGRCSFIEGKIIEIAHLVQEWCPDGGDYYLIEVQREVYPSKDPHKAVMERVSTGWRIHIPVNGTLVQGVRVSDKGVFERNPEAVSWKTFGVIRI